MRKRKRVKFDRSRCYRTFTWWRDAIIHRPHTPSEGFWNVRHVSLGNLEELTTSSSECCHWLWHWFWVQCYLIKTFLHSDEILIWSSLSLLHKTDMLSVKSRLHQYIESFTCYINTFRKQWNLKGKVNCAPAERQKWYYLHVFFQDSSGHISVVKVGSILLTRLWKQPWVEPRAVQM